MISKIIAWWKRSAKPVPIDNANEIVWKNSEWWEVCKHCGGNCGQCGNQSLRLRKL